MTCDFTYVLTVFQSYQDNERMIMKGCVQILIYVIQHESTFRRVSQPREANRKSQKMLPFVKLAGKLGGVRINAPKGIYI